MRDARRIGGQIKHFRGLAALSKSESARRVNVSPTAVHNWEENGVMPRMEVVIDLQDVLQVDFIQLMTGDASADDRKPSEPEHQINGQPEVSRKDRLDQFRRQIAALFEVPFDRVEIVIRA